MDPPRAGTDYPRSVGEFQAWFRTDADCLDYPLTVTDKHGGVRMHPLAVEARQAREQVARLARVLRIHVEPPEEGRNDAA